MIQALADALAKMSSEEESVKGEGVAAGAGAAADGGVAQGGAAADGGVAPGTGATPGGAGLGFKVPSLPSSPAGKPTCEAMKYSKIQNWLSFCSIKTEVFKSILKNKSYIR